MHMHVTFPGGARVDAGFGGFEVPTDQPEKAGGQGSAPAPFDLFLASLATCAGYYALRFCQGRELDTEGLELDLVAQRDPETKDLTIHLDLQLPEGFPDKYRPAIVRAMDQCAVKKALENPPAFEVRTTAAEPAPVA